MIKFFLGFMAALLFSCGTTETNEINSFSKEEKEKSEIKIAILLDKWHNAASDADFDSYFGMMAENSVFIGTDATENWNKQEFMEWSKPYFDRGKAWNFSALERNIFVGETGEIAWFDELLDTQMGLARGSGVVINENGVLKIKHYVLSLTIPNDKLSEATKIKSEEDWKKAE